MHQLYYYCIYYTADEPNTPWIYRTLETGPAISGSETDKTFRTWESDFLQSPRGHNRKSTEDLHSMSRLQMEIPRGKMQETVAM